MKVLLVANTDWYLYNFRLALAKVLRQSGNEVVMVSPLGRYTRGLVLEGFRHRALVMNRRSLNVIKEADVIRQLIGLYRTEQPDVVHHFTVKCVVYGSLAARIVGVPSTVNAVAGLGHAFTSDSVWMKLLSYLIQALFRYGADFGRSRTIVQNREDYAALLGHHVITPQRIRLIRGSGVDCSKFAPTGQRAQRPLTVLLATRLLWSKGIADYVGAAMVLRSRVRDVKFLLAGEPDDGNPASVGTKDVEAWEKQGLIEALGHVEDMERLLRNVDIFVLPTSYGEGTPRVLLEAAASGLPIVASDVAGCREIVENGVNGFLVPPKDVGCLADAIERLAHDPNLREQFGQAGRQKAVAEFDEAMVIDETLNVYRELCASFKAS